MPTFSPEIEMSLLQQAQTRFRILSETSVPELLPQQKHQIRQGERAIAQLLSQYERFLYKQIHRLCPGADIDAAFSAALKGFSKAIEGFNFATPFMSWLKIKISGALLCEKRKGAVSTIKNFKLTQILQNEIGISDTATFNQAIPQIQEAIEKLKDVERLCLRLFSEGNAWAEVGEAVGKSPDAARMTVKRAVLKIQIELGLVEAPKRKARKIRRTPAPIFWMQSYVRRSKEGKVVRFSGRAFDIKSTFQN
ncbi:MAG: sigma-70 family RNA polymerase sigma factor, partial [Thermosynechococcaceae cyanobacterium MS004]|nr:sigma-70 family RNA polymerase sigma factor [Thermosynechococcaceae cyanobacterium MS004]